MRGLPGVALPAVTWPAVALAMLLAACPAPSHAQKSADTLRVAWRDSVATLDPYRNQQRSGLILAHHLFDGLVHRDPESFILKPLLATAWRYIRHRPIPPVVAGSRLAPDHPGTL